MIVECDIGETAYFGGPATNDTGGSAADASSGPTGYAHLVGPTVNAAPITAGITVSLLSEGTWPAGCYQTAVAATVGNGFAAGSDYDIFVQGTVDSETPVGYIGRLRVRAANSQTDDMITRVLLALPAAAADGAGGLPISDAGGLDLDTLLGRLDAAITSRHASGAAVASVSGAVGSMADAGASLTALGDTRIANLDAAITSRAAAAKLLDYVQLLARSDAAIAADNSVALGEINTNEGSGAGDYANTTDAQEAARDRGDAAWVTATGFSTHSAADVWAVGTRTLTSFGTLVADIWAALTSGLTAVGSIGKLLVDNLNATVSSRSSHSAADAGSAAATAILVTPANKIGTDANNRVAADTQEISGDSVAADNLEAMCDGTGAVLYATHIDGDLDGKVLGTGTGTITGTGVQASVAALTAAGITAVASAVWDALTSGMTTVGSIGKKLADWTILTSQAVRDAMKLAPTAGDPAAGSLDKHEDDILEDTAAIDALTKASGSGDLAALWTRIQAVTDADSVLLDAVQRLAIVSAWAARKPSDEEAVAEAGSFGSIMGLMGQKHKVTVTDNGDGTSTLTCYKSDGTTTWFTATLTNVAPTATTPTVITGVSDTA